MALHGKPVSELRSVTCHMGSLIVTFYLSQLNVLYLNSSQTGQEYSIFLDGLPVCRHPSTNGNHLIVTGTVRTWGWFA